MKQKGFTVIEVFVVIVLLGVGGWLFYSERANVLAVQRDAARKVAINAMYYSLEEVFYDKNQYYPSSIDSKTLRAVDPALFTDPNGIKLGDTNSSYRYEPTGCTTEGKCTGYKLRALTEREGDYTKSNRNR